MIPGLGVAENRSGDWISPYLLVKPQILLDACRALGHDEGGRRCPTCCVREFCDRQARRIGRDRAVDD